MKNATQHATLTLACDPKLKSEIEALAFRRSVEQQRRVTVSDLVRCAIRQMLESQAADE